MKFEVVLDLTDSEERRIIDNRGYVTHENK